MVTAKARLPKWFLVILFTSYVSGITLFTHTHVINNTTYVHSHPFKKGEKSEHTHTEKQLFILEHYYQTSLTSDIIPNINLTDPSLPRLLPYKDTYKTPTLEDWATDIPVRGPPFIA